MKLLLDVIDGYEGFASRGELLGNGVNPGLIDLASWYERDVIRVRKGWYARAAEHPEVIRAWRVGGRLTCVSALALHTGEPATPVLHLEVPAAAARLRDPDRHRRRLSLDSAVVVHWTRFPGPGGRRAVTAEHAELVAAVCGVQSAGVARVKAGQAAADSACASRIV